MKQNKLMSFYLKRNWKSVTLTCLLGIVAEAVYALCQLLMMRSFDAVFQLDLHGFLVWTAITVGGWMAYISLATLSEMSRAGAKRKLNNQLRHDLYLSMLGKSHQEYHAQDTGEYISQLTTNIKQIERLAWDPFCDSVVFVARVGCCMIAMLSLHWSMLAVGLLSALIMLVLPNLVGRNMEALGHACADAEAKGTSQLKDLLSGFDVLRSFGRTDRLLDQGDIISDEMEKPNCRRYSTQQCISGINGIVSICLQILQQVIAVVLGMRGIVMLGSFATVSNLTAGIANGLSQLANSRMSMASAKPYFENITTHETPVEHKPMKEVERAISIEDLSFRYGEKPILEKASFHFEKGGKYALTGPSGCGKSTLLKLLLGWLPGYSGTIRFDGADAREYAPEQLQQQMSCIEQNVFLFNTTIRENITLGREFSDEAMEEALRGSALLEDLAGMPDGLDTMVGEEGSCLSGGQKQRIAIARALIHDRSILLVDEGTSALDQKNADIVEKSLLDNPDFTLILVSHHLNPERKRQFTKVYELEPAVAAP